MANWQRASRRKSPRRKLRFHVDGMTAAQLAAKVGIATRTVRFYTAEGVLPSPEFHGAATRYTQQHLICLAAIRWLQRERRMSLPAIRDQLRSTSTEDVQRMAAALLPELAAADAATASAGSPAPPPAPSERAAALNDAWHRVTLVPGLELHLHVNAGAEVQALARSLMARGQ
jgi:DNA-binding transcriptional MerR regulator